MRKINLIFLVFVVFFNLSSFVFADEDGTNEEGLKISSYISRTANGPVQGIIKASRNSTKHYVAFMGLRYADPPKRFEISSSLTETWTDPKVAYSPGSNCPQITEAGVAHDNEDCLFLNVYVPKSHLESEDLDLKPLPIMFFLHGGGFSFGDGTEYGADYFMENQDVILVTINYRLSVFGFLSLEDDTIPSNLGLRDQVEALRWVKKNIASFKGDPDDVTIFGNSAGSASVQYLLLTDLAKGLFHKAIMQSGAMSFWSYSPNPRKAAIKYAEHLGCALGKETESVSKEVRKCLEGKSAKELVMSQTTFWPRWPTGNMIGWFVPTDKEDEKDTFFPQKLSSFFTKSRGKPLEYISKVPVMLGTVRDEGATLFAAMVFSEEGAIQDLDQNWNALAPRAFLYEDFFPPDKLEEISKRIRAFYFGKMGSLTVESLHFLTTLYTDAFFLLPVIQAGVDMARDREMKVYPYVFSYVGSWSLRDALQLKEMKGMIGHADELQYQFPHYFLGPPLEADSTSEKLSRRFVKLWTSFAKDGEPAAKSWTEGLDIDWDPIKVPTKPKRQLEFNVLRIDTKLKLVKSEFLDRLNFWRDLLNEVVFQPDVNKAKTEL